MGYLYESERAGKYQVQSRDWLEHNRKAWRMYIYGNVNEIVYMRTLMSKIERVREVQRAKYIGINCYG